ncbi:GNAT family N-acetyltransferase [Marixanthomonas ophiurae]|uniref:GNAT family N-acetyltransferase n=1 Tax=Marixanthomonas ophiurae TaxID=387659 RepID=A0A3E1Q8Y1_9FLAO|nr:GNAT family N-acetyltransferase [Marixanthomonas ophiurae]RFN58593.1 GNAT family N-acetyltransferase [Marixanthomonas ophiurae]
MKPASSILIKQVQSKSVLELQKIAKETFFETYASENTKEDMDAYLAKNFNTEHLQRSIINPDSFYYFAMNHQEVIGYLKVNQGSAQTDNKLPDALEIERIYILSKFQRKGVGKLLLKKAVEKAQSFNIKTLWLSVWDKNQKAIYFYKNQGFKAFDNQFYWVGTDKQTDVLMKLELDF